MSIPRTIAPRAILILALLSLGIAVLVCAHSGLLAPVTSVSAPTPVASSPFPKDTLISESRQYEIARGAEYVNTSPQAVSGELMLSVIPNLEDRQSHCQRVISQTFSPEPSRYETDRQGNTWAVFPVKSLAPKKKVVVSQNAQVRIANLTRAISVADLPKSFTYEAASASQKAPQPNANENTNVIYEELDGETVTSYVPDSVTSRAMPSPSPNALDKRFAEVVHREADRENRSWYRILRLFDFVRSLDFRLEDDPRTLDKVLDTRQAQCLDAACLLAALIRSDGGKTRVASGLYLRPENPTDIIHHAWTEVQLPRAGWVPLDPTMGRFPEARSSRIAQLDCYYLTLWLGEEPRTMATWHGPKGKLTTRFSHHMTAIDAHNEPGSTLSQAVSHYIQVLNGAQRAPKETSATDKTAAVNAPADADKTASASATTNADKAASTNAPADADKAVATNAPADADKAASASATTNADKTASTNAPADADKAVATNSHDVVANTDSSPNNASGAPSYSERESTLNEMPAGAERDRESVAFYAETKQMIPLWQALTDGLNEGADIDSVLIALTLAAESGDWESLDKIASRALAIFGDDESLLGAWALACFHRNDDKALQSALERIHRLTKDGYSQAMWGTMCLDAYRYNEAIKHWQQAIQIGLPPAEAEQYREQIKKVRDILNNRAPARPATEPQLGHQQGPS